ncbi:ribonuclease H [Spirochaetia bacterium]|nr:ribonuclease H [Spirochaetia bacterium]
MTIDIYTDGGCSGNPGPGGWAYVITDNVTRQIITESSGGEKLTTNNKMELSAVIFALDYIKDRSLKPEKICVFTDSQYVQKGITEWIHRWKKNGWKTAAKKPVVNADLWRTLDEKAKALPVIWNWVKGHAGVPLNERCDELTQIAIDKYRK